MTGRRFFWSTIEDNSASALLTDLVEYWKFDTDEDGELGTNLLSQTGTTLLVSGKINDGLEKVSTGSTDYADDSRFSFTNGSNDLPFSISFWIYPKSLSTNAFIFHKRNASGQNEYAIICPNANRFINVNLYSNNSTTTRLQAVSNTAIPLNTWSHVVVTYDGSETVAGITIYINGSAVATTDTTVGTYLGMANSTANISMFSYPSGSFTTFGILDEFGIWKNRELTSSDVSELYNSGSGLQYPF